MRIIKIRKKSGGHRTIYVPSPEEQDELRLLVSDITRRAARADTHGVVHGFAVGRSPVTMATAHVGHRFTTCFDLADFFDSVGRDKLQSLLPKETLDKIIVDGAARQGLPTSPPAANLAAVSMDRAILTWISRRNKQAVYTRYADDLAISYDDPGLTAILLREIPQIIRRCGFAANSAKTRTMDARRGRRHVCGIAVDDNAIHPTRRAKRRLRAAKHRAAQPEATERSRRSARGLEEWCKLTAPRERIRDRRKDGDDLVRLARAWRVRLAKSHIEHLPDKGLDIDIGSCCTITTDPIYMLGMSTWTTGWTSCMSQPHGQYRQGVVYWMLLRGTRLACFLAEKTMVVAGVERRVMRARALVHTLRDGVMVYDRLYGNPGDKEILEARLIESGCISVAEARKSHAGQAVVGHSPAASRPYMDSLRKFQTKASAGPWTGRSVVVAKI